MNVTLTQVQQQWLEGEVAAGRFPSIETAILAAIDAAMRTGDLAAQKSANAPVKRSRAELIAGQLAISDRCAALTLLDDRSDDEIWH